MKRKQEKGVGTEKVKEMKKEKGHMKRERKTKEQEKRNKNNWKKS